EDVRRMLCRPLLEERDPSSRSVVPRWVDDSWLDEPDPWLCAHQLRHPHERRVIREPRIVIEEEEELSTHVWDTFVATGGNSDVLRERQRTHAVRETGGLPPVAYAQDVKVHSPLGQQRIEPTPEVIRALPLRQHHDSIPVTTACSRAEQRAAGQWSRPRRMVSVRRPRISLLAELRR